MPEGRKNYTKTKPLRDAEFDECRGLWDERSETEHSWLVPAQELSAGNFNLDIKNPNAPDALAHRPPEELVMGILEKERKILTLMASIRESLEAAES